MGGGEDGVVVVVVNLLGEIGGERREGFLINKYFFLNR